MVWRRKWVLHVAVKNLGVLGFNPDCMHPPTIETYPVRNSTTALRCCDSAILFSQPKVHHMAEASAMQEEESSVLCDITAVLTFLLE